MTKQTGQCLCGSLKYEVTEEPVMSANCHCTHCQKTSGAAFSTNIVVPVNGFEIKGNTLTTYVDQGDSGQHLRRYFCNTCGSPIYTDVDVMPGVVVVKAGTLDDTTSYTPGANIWCDSQMSWLKNKLQAPDFEKMPPSE